MDCEGSSGGRERRKRPGVGSIRGTGGRRKTPVDQAYERARGLQEQPKQPDQAKKRNRIFSGEKVRGKSNGEELDGKCGRRREPRGLAPTQRLTRKQSDWQGRREKEGALRTRTRRGTLSWKIGLNLSNSGRGLFVEVSKEGMFLSGRQEGIFRKDGLTRRVKRLFMRG